MLYCCSRESLTCVCPPSWRKLSTYWIPNRSSRSCLILKLRNRWPLITSCCVVTKGLHYPLNSSRNPTVIAASVGSRINTWQNNFGGAGPWNTYRHFNLNRSGKERKGTSLWTISCFCARNRFLVVSGRAAVWLRSILTLMADCDRSKWKPRIHCCDDLWPNSAAFNCEVIVTKLCRMPLWIGCSFVVNLFVVKVRTIKSVERLFLCCYFHFNGFPVCLGTCAVTLFLNVPLVSSLRGVCYGKFPFNFKLIRSVRAFSVALVSALSTWRFTWLLRFVCVLAVCGGWQLVSGFEWKRVYFGLTDDDEVI